MTGFFAEQLAGRLDVVELAAEVEVAEVDVAEVAAGSLHAARARARAPVTTTGRAPLIFTDCSFSSCGMGSQILVGEEGASVPQVAPRAAAASAGLRVRRRRMVSKETPARMIRPMTRDCQ